MPIISNVSQNKNHPQKTVLIIVGIGALLSIIYVSANYKFMFLEDRTASRLAGGIQNESDEKRQVELINSSYLINGYEQGSLDAQCTNWLCAVNLQWNGPARWLRGSITMRGNIIMPFNSLVINRRGLTIEEKSYYNSGYIKGYKEMCSKYRSDCAEKIKKMIADYNKYYEAPLYDVTGSEQILTLARKVETKMEDGLVLFKIDDGEYITINTDEIVGNKRLPLRDNTVGKPLVSLDKKNILLEVAGSNGNLSYLVFEIDNRLLHKVSIDPFPFAFVKIIWTKEGYLFIQKYGNTPTGMKVVTEYISTDRAKPWEVKQRPPIMINP